MSRCVVKHTDAEHPYHELVVGLDSPMNCWFGQVYDTRVPQDDSVCGKCDKTLSTGCECNEVVDWSPVLSKGGLLEYMLRWHVDLTDPYAKAVYDHIALGLDPGKVERS